MKLKSDEQSILATFKSSTNAEKALKALEEAGFREVQLDRISEFGVNANSEYNNPIAGQAFTQTGLTLYSGDSETDQSTRILLSGDPSVGGYGENYNRAQVPPFLLTVVCKKEQVNGTVKIIKEHEGEV
ncbi:hypothetical protein RDV78_07580 [Bacillota bacterium LX-D]|nr:hypothetical protein [Bacillota bacterium LX-D]